MKKQKRDGGSSSRRIADARFSSFETDPRFRLPSKKHTKTTVDERFSGMLEDKDFIATATVDRYGRKFKSDAKKKALQRLYRTEEEGAEQDEEEEEKAKKTTDADELVQQQLRQAHDESVKKKLDPARNGGFSCSESDSDDDSDDDSLNSSSADDKDDEDGDGTSLAVEHGVQRLQNLEADIEDGQVTNHLAVVNLDWDHVNSTDLMALFSSFLPPKAGPIVKISVYPSEFGKERMQQEEVEGPPKALFQNKKATDSDSDSDSDSDGDSESGDEKIKKGLIKEGDDQDFDSDALRSYQLDRLRYYYAVLECSSLEAAKKIYEATDGTEYQSSSNVIDLRFVPDDVTFDDEPRDECTELPNTYKPVDFVTNALQSSKVKLTWDTRPEEASRKESINKAFKGSRHEIGENDLRAYLASDSDGEDEVEEEEEADNQGEPGKAEEPKLTKRELARKKMREALGLAEEAKSSRINKDGPVGDMQITFAPAFAGPDAQADDKEETTIDKYKRKERERKERKRQDAKAKREGPSQTYAREKDAASEESGEDAGFDDPFFTIDDTAASAPSKTQVRKEERLKKRAARQAAEAEKAEQTSRLSKVMTEGADEGRADRLAHFDMKEIVRAEKEKSKKKKYRKNKGEAEADAGGLQQGFEMDVADDRFNAVFESHEFAIDPSNPKFTATGGMKQLLEEGRKKRKVGDDDATMRGGETTIGGNSQSKRAKKARR